MHSTSRPHNTPPSENILTELRKLTWGSHFANLVDLKRAAETAMNKESVRIAPETGTERRGDPERAREDAEKGDW